MKKYIAEFFGTFVLTLTVTASIFSAAGVPTALWVGLTLAMLVFTIGAVSGGHYNPAVTFGMLVMKKISVKDGVIYILLQALAGIAVWGITMAMALQLPAFRTEFSVYSFVAEIIGMAIFAFGISGALDKARGGLQTAVIIGLSLTMGAYIGGGLGSYGIINPAIALGVHVWAIPYLVAPFIGSVVGMLIYRFLGQTNK